MRELELKFDGKGEVKGYSFEQKYFENNWYIYLVTRDEEPDHYEVFKRIEVQAYPPYSLVDYVQYPKSNAFGVSAWTTETIERALEIINNKTNE